MKDAKDERPKDKSDRIQARRIEVQSRKLRLAHSIARYRVLSGDHSIAVTGSSPRHSEEINAMIEDAMRNMEEWWMAT